MPNLPLQQDLTDLRELIERLSHTLEQCSPQELASLEAQEPLATGCFNFKRWTARRVCPGPAN